MTNRKLSVALLGAALALSACGSRVEAVETAEAVTEVDAESGEWAGPTAYTAPPPPPAAPVFREVGDVVGFQGAASGTVTLNGTERITEPETSYTSAVPTYGSWLVVDVTVNLTSADESGYLAVSAYDFTAQTPDGTVHPFDYNPLETTLSTEVRPGRMVRGKVAFDVPEGETLVDWSPSLGGAAVSWKITD